MAYNAIDQREPDAYSDSADSHSSASSPELHRNKAHHRLSNDMEDFEPPLRPSVTRVSSSASIPLRHPTPDLQSLQGAYVGNIERLEQSAERLSMSGSDIGEELRKLRIEQKRSESRRSSLMNTYLEEEQNSPLSRQLSRQFSYEYGSRASNSINGMNSVARSGGFSPGGYFTSPRGSLRSEAWSRRNSIKGRSASNGSRLAQMLESKQQGSPTNVVAGLTPIRQPSEPSNKVFRVPNDEQLSRNDTQRPQDTDSLSSANDEQTSPNDVQKSRGNETFQFEPSKTNQDIPPRPSSADTYQQAQAAGLFADFDGVHASPQTQPADIQPHNVDEPSRRRSSGRIASAGRPQSYLEPIPGENMVYYPAPVPMMLNLPQKLSKQPTAPQRDQRRSELLSGINPDARKSAAWLPDVLDGEHRNEKLKDGELPAIDQEKRKSKSGLPPQLRASLFFDYPSVQQNIEIKGGSAVQTLDSILDASAFAPVSAFTDHPIAGRVGPEVYGSANNGRGDSQLALERPENRPRKSSINVLKKRNSSSNLLEDKQKQNGSFLSLTFGRRKTSAQQAEDTNVDPELTSLRSGNGADEDLANQDAEYFDAQSQLDGDRAEEESDLIETYTSGPNTLLSELQLRKEQQKQRNRTAATAFPNGMHSTLLELDAVAQIQKQSRLKKHTVLAWEDPDAQYPGEENEDDEDVPLGVLFPGRKSDPKDNRGRFDEDRPLGLIAKREMEDNEPLSHRRARLRGEPHAALRRTPSPDRRGSMYTLDLPSFEANQPPITQPDDDEVEGETLAQRLKRLKNKKQQSSQGRTISGGFASEIMSQLGVPEAGKPASKEAAPSPSPDPEDETLAQRRARLQAEKEARNVSNGSNARPPMTKRRSMADLLQAHPAAGAGSRVSSNEKPMPLPSSVAPKTPWAMKVQQRALSGEMPAVDGAFGAFHPPVNGNANSRGRAVSGGVPNPLILNGLNGIDSDGVAEVRNRDMIDRWRQSVHY